eukprot:4509941-Amphidinium_carterae.1
MWLVKTAEKDPGRKDRNALESENAECKDEHGRTLYLEKCVYDDEVLALFGVYVDDVCAGGKKEVLVALFEA